MILSASRRTDIPSYYSEWFMNRIRAGCALTRNPMNGAQLCRVALTPDIVDCLVFWTKDARNMLPALPELDRLGYKYCFLFTLTPYDRAIEPRLREKTAIADTFIELSKQIGKERVVWRYDPIILNDSLDMAFHKANFERLCDKLASHADSVVISFVDLYPKLKTGPVREISADEIEELSAFIGKTARERGLRVSACCEKHDLARYGIEKTGCVSKAWLERVCGFGLNIRRDKNQREGCGCVESVDIGAYGTCPAGCVYCYANRGQAAAQRRFFRHDPRGELLAGAAGEGERISERKLKSNKI